MGTFWVWIVVGVVAGYLAKNFMGEGRKEWWEISLSESSARSLAGGSSMTSAAPVLQASTSARW
jgi:hypothetical protein